MPYPSPYTRNSNFQQIANAGQESPAPDALDTELNDIATTLEQIRTRLNNVTSADGRLRNIAARIAQSLVGTWVSTSDGTTLLATDIEYQAAMSVNSVLVLAGTTVLRPDQIASVADDGSGNLDVTLVSALTLGSNVVVWAFEPGNSLLTILASAANGDGASRIAIEDAAGLYTATDVEMALAEIRDAFNDFVTLVGDIGTILRSDVAIPWLIDQDAGGFKLTNLLAGEDAGDAVTVGQIAAYVAIWSDLEQFYLKRDGTVEMTGNLPMGTNKITGLGDADLDEDGDAVNVKVLKAYLSSEGAIPIGTVIDYAGSTPPSVTWLICDGAAYLGTDYPTLFALLPSPFKSGPAQGAQAAYFTAKIVAGNITGGALTSLPPFSGGVGYSDIPDYEVINPDGTENATVVLTFASPTATSLTGATVSGGVLSTPTITNGGSGVLEGSVIRIRAVTSGDADAIVQLPNGYFRTPDLRARVTVGVGLESKTPGIYDPPSESKGDDYDADNRTLGEVGGQQDHKLTEAELAAHYHTWHSGSYGSNITSIASDENSKGTLSKTYNTDDAGGDAPHENMPPFFVLNKLIKAL